MFKTIVKIAEYSGEGIGGVTESEHWSVLLLNYLPRLAPDALTDMQKHRETDECFILLSGKAVLFTARGEDAPLDLECYPLKLGAVYRVPQGIWHTQAMSRDAKILLVENTGTTPENSPRCGLTQEQIAEVHKWCAKEM